MSNPLVSIIIPTYNRTYFLDLTIQSVLSQTYQHTEIIVIDDGTPNDKNEILCKKSEKVQYIKIKNSGGPARPRNMGIHKAKGKYIAFVDDDDLWLPTKLEKQVAILENNLDFGLVHSCCEVIDENGIKKNEIIGRPGSQDVKHGDVSMRMMGNWTLMMSTPLISKKVLDAVGFYNEIMPAAGEDTEFWTRCSFATNFYYIDEPLAQYRVHSQNISSRKENYRKLPFYLKEVLIQQRINKRISNSQYDLLISKMCINQINYIRDHYKLTIQILFELDYFWIFKIQNFKCLIYNVFFRK
ncbi:glycosyltransferase family 2 protein [Flavobacterium sp.]|jgi:glycosyltransferase involved in cell wall biosynthesis|uniref:glycosyltransferase family 2 protein n=1 Tax=Flavobacterium sp. TaxID=239 RepID=UPI0037BF1055